MNDYITIAEFADRADISKQAVYQRLNTSLKAYVKVEQGKKLLNIKALEEVYDISLEQGFQGSLKVIEQDLNKIEQDIQVPEREQLQAQIECLKDEKREVEQLAEQLKRENELLREHIARLDEITKNKADTIKQLSDQVTKGQKLIDQQQQLTLIAQQRVLQLEDQAEKQKPKWKFWK